MIKWGLQGFLVSCFKLTMERGRVVLDALEPPLITSLTGCFPWEKRCCSSNSVTFMLVQDAQPLG